MSSLHVLLKSSKWYCGVLRSHLLNSMLLHVHNSSRLRGGREWGHSSICSLGGLACWVDDHTASPLVTSGSMISWWPQWSLPIRSPQVPLLRGPSTVVVQVCCRTVILSRPSRHNLPLYSLSLWLPVSKDPASLPKRSPVGHSGPEPKPNDDHLRLHWLV